LALLPSRRGAVKSNFMPLDFIFTLRERENARLAGGEDWIRTRGCVSPDDRTLLAHKVRIPPVCGKRRVQTKNRANWIVYKPSLGLKVKGIGNFRVDRSSI